MQHSPQAQVFGVAANGTQFTIHWEFAISVCSTPLCRSPVAPSLSDVATTMAATKAKQRQTAKTNGQKHKQNGGQESSSSAVFVVSAKLLYPGEGKEMGIGREKERGTERSHKFKIARKRRPQSQTPQYAIIKGIFSKLHGKLTGIPKICYFSCSAWSHCAFRMSQLTTTADALR